MNFEAVGPPYYPRERANLAPGPPRPMGALGTHRAQGAHGTHGTHGDPWGPWGPWGPMGLMGPPRGPWGPWGPWDPWGPMGPKGPWVNFEAIRFLVGNTLNTEYIQQLEVKIENLIQRKVSFYLTPNLKTNQNNIILYEADKS